MTIEQKLKVFRTLLRDHARIQAINAAPPRGTMETYHHEAHGKRLAYEDALRVLNDLLPEVPSAE